MIGVWWQVVLLALLFGFTSWAGQRIATWQDNRLAKRKFEGSLRSLEEVIAKASKAAEEVHRARQSGSDD